MTDSLSALGAAWGPPGSRLLVEASVVVVEEDSSGAGVVETRGRG